MMILKNSRAAEMQDFEQDEIFMEEDGKRQTSRK